MIYACLGHCKGFQYQFMASLQKNDSMSGLMVLPVCMGTNHPFVPTTSEASTKRSYYRMLTIKIFSFAFVIVLQLVINCMISSSRGGSKPKAAYKRFLYECYLLNSSMLMEGVCPRICTYIVCTYVKVNRPRKRMDQANIVWMRVERNKKTL